MSNITPLFPGQDPPEQPPGQELDLEGVRTTCLACGGSLEDSPTYERHLPGAAEVKIVNASKLHLPERKRLGTMHTRYSGYPGGLKVETLDALIARSGHGEVVRKAIYGMLPHNKLRARAMKRLSVEE